MDRANHLGEPVARRQKRRAVLLAALIAPLLVAAAGVPAMAQEEPTLEVVPRASRNVTPPGVTPGPEVDGPLVREALPPPPPEPAKWRRFPLPETTDAATFRANRVTIRVSGVDPVPVDQVCRRAGGEEWPCGRTALHSLRMFLRGRAIECYLPPLGQAVEAIAPCRVGQTDLGAWLLRQGWATPNDYATDEYRAAALDGRCHRLGMWQGTTADGTCPATGN
jgi:endonuclease YncB( thermonuclease family)